MGFLEEIDRRKQQAIQKELNRGAELERGRQIAIQEAATAIERQQQLAVEEKKRVAMNAERIERDAINFIKERLTIAGLFDQMNKVGYKGYFEKVSEISGFSLERRIHTKYQHEPSANPELARQQLDAQKKLEHAFSQFGWSERMENNNPNVMFFGDHLTNKRMKEPEEAGIGIRFLKAGRINRWGKWRTERAGVDYVIEHWDDAAYIRIDSQSKATITGSTQRQVDLRDLRLLDEILEKAIHKPATVYDKHTSIFDTYTPRESCGPCLPGDSFISVPKGSVQVKNLKIGDLVWTIDRFGNKVQAVIIQKTKKPVSKNHKMAHIVLEDGRNLIVSPGHPTIHNTEIGNLVKGDVLDGSCVLSVSVIPYMEKYTYDILPFGDSGAYWANNILIGSTLSNQFKNNQWYRQLFV